MKSLSEKSDSGEASSDFLQNNLKSTPKGAFGADGGGRTRTPAKATDFESVKSANSITSARANNIIP